MDESFQVVVVLVDRVTASTLRGLAEDLAVRTGQPCMESALVRACLQSAVERFTVESLQSGHALTGPAFMALLRRDHESYIGMTGGADGD